MLSNHCSQVLARRLRLEGDFDFAQVAARTPGFVGADLTALVKEAAAIAVTRIFSQLQARVGVHTAQRPAVWHSRVKLFTCTCYLSPFLLSLALKPLQ